jgi:HD-like signal output (HDOD) protein
MVGIDPMDVIEKKVKNLPLIDSAVVKAITLLNNPDSNFEQIVDRLSPDLSARFLNIANSAYYGREVRSISFAVKLLGYSKMKDILVTSILMDHFTKRLKDFDFDKFMKQAQFCAGVARTLGEILDFNRHDDLFTVATLQNMGKLVIAVYFKKEHKQIIALKKSQRLSTREAENRILGISHGEIGAIVLRRFSIPEEICEAVRFHDTPDNPAFEPADSLLPYIAREATRIVARFKLPEETHPLQLTTVLGETVSEGKKNCREHVRQEIRSRGYPQIFPELLTKAAALIVRDLKFHLPERDPQAEDEADAILT